ncbi:MAG: IS110 family transposase [Pyrinomonadaceae bacterium]
MSKNILGIDVSKRKLDVALLFNDKTLVKKFDNTASGCKLLVAWLETLHREAVHVCLESTGTYGDLVAHSMHNAGHIVSVVNPLRIKSYAVSALSRNKTDMVDARMIADFCRTQIPEQWFPPSPQVVKIQGLSRRIEALEEMRQAERNRLDVSPQETRASIKRVIKTFEKEIKDLEKKIKDNIDQDPKLKNHKDLLETIPGIGKKTSHLLLAEIEFERFDSARDVAAYAGVTPKQRKSGTSLNYTRLSKMGNKRLRKRMYFPAIVAGQCNEIIKDFAKRLAKNGKSGKQIVCASIRKLLHIAFGVLKNQTPFDPDLAFQS